MYSLILHGRRLVEFQKCFKLRFAADPLLNASAFSNSFSSASAAADISLRDGRKGQNFTVSYLVDSLGLTTKLAQSISKRVCFEEKGNPDSVLNLFKSYGFTDSQISSIITDHPSLLILDAEKSLAPKLEFLQSRGASTSELTETLSKVPKILGIEKKKPISVYYDFVKEVIEADTRGSKFEMSCISLLEGSVHENKIRNVLVLRELGVPQRLLFSSLISDHRNLCCGKERFKESLKKVVEMGFDPKTSKFVEALHAVNQVTDKTIQEKVDLYKRLGFDVWEMFKKWPSSMNYSEKKILNSTETFLGLGFTRDEFTMMVKSQPQCIGYSSEMVKKKTEFLVKKMNWPLKAVASNPAVLGLSMEKRIVPRCNVIKALLSKGLIGSEPPPISTVLVCTDEVFLRRYVRKHGDQELVAELMSILTGINEKKQIKLMK